MKTENYLLLIGIVILVGIGIFYMNKGNKTETKEDTLLFNYGSSEKITQKTQKESNSDLSQNMNAQKTQSMPAMTIDPNKTYTAVMKTTAGDMTIELNAKMTPKTVNNFVYLAKKKFYNNVIFHRTIKGFMIQGGDPTGTGAGGPGYQFEDEFFEGEYTRGTVAMANAGPDTNGSQFFIMHADYPLPKDYTIFGKVTNGIEVVDKIAEAPTKPGGEGSTPVNPVKITSVTIEEK